MTHTFIIAQTLGFIGVACFVLSYQIKSNKALFLLQTLASVFFGTQFFLLGGISGCFNLMVVIVRNIMIYNHERYKWLAWRGWIGVIIAVCVVILIVTWKGPQSLFPFIAMVGSTIGYWSSNAQKIRLSNLVCACPAWFTYDIIVGSFGGMLNEAIGVTSILVSIYRYGWKNMGDSQFSNADENAEAVGNIEAAEAAENTESAENRKADK